MEISRVGIKDKFNTVFYLLKFPIHCRKLKIRIPGSDQRMTVFLNHRRVTWASPFPVFTFNDGNCKASGNGVRLQ